MLAALLIMRIEYIALMVTFGNNAKKNTIRPNKLCGLWSRKFNNMPDLCEQHAKDIALFVCSAWPKADYSLGCPPKKKRFFGRARKKSQNGNWQNIKFVGQQPNIGNSTHAFFLFML